MAIKNFNFYLPTRIVFGNESIEKLPDLIPKGSRVMLTYGGGSIKKNGVYDKVVKVVHPVCEFGGIEPNPTHETCMKAVELAKKNNITFLLAVGGGSVIDGTKYITCAMGWDKSPDPYDIILHWGFGYPQEPAFEPHAKVPIGTVLTLPAAGSEANCGSVVSHHARQLKKPFAHESCFPVFSILDPEVTYSLPPRQLANGIVDAYVHVLEQYFGHTIDAKVQDRQSEGLLCNLRDVAPTVIANKKDYNAAANFMWAASMALNGLIGLGVNHCWASHMIGHEITAFYGLDHGQTLALTVPAVMKHEKNRRVAKFTQYAERVFGIKGPDAADQAIIQTEKFFESVGNHTRLSKYGMDGKHFAEIAKRLSGLGPDKSIDSKAVAEILDILL